MTEQEVSDLFAPLGVTKVEACFVGSGGWCVRTTSTHRQVGKFLHENNLLDRAGGSGTGRSQSFYFDNPAWSGKLPKSWLPKEAKPADDYALEVVACKAALVAAGFEVRYLRAGLEEGVKVTDNRLLFNLAFVVDGYRTELHAKFLASGQTFHNQHNYVKVSVDQAVELTRRATTILDGL